MLNIDVSHEVEHEQVVSACVIAGRLTWRPLRKSLPAEHRLSSNILSNAVCRVSRDASFSKTSSFLKSNFTEVFLQPE